MVSLCETCSSPGHCCKDFALNNGEWNDFDADKWQDEGKAFVMRHDLPFLPLRVAGPDENSGNVPRDGRVFLRFTCPLLTPEGRCGDYENRPRLCRVFEAASDRLCVMYVAPVDAPGEPKVIGDE